MLTAKIGSKLLFCGLKMPTYLKANVLLYTRILFISVTPFDGHILTPEIFVVKYKNIIYNIELIEYFIKGGATMTSSEIDAFLAVCKYNSISRAAEKLFISQSSLSTKIKTLEKEINCRLIVRDRGLRTVELTDEGRKFLELAVKYQEIVREMMAIGEKKKTRILRVSSLNSTGTYLFAPVYDRFMRLMPDTLLDGQDMLGETVYISMENGETDMAFIVDRRESKKIITYPAFSEEMVFICSSQSSYKQNIDINVLDVKNEVYIDWSSQFVNWHKGIFGDMANPRIKLDIMSHLEFFARKEDAWAIVPSSVAYGLIKNEYIEKRDILFHVPKRIIYCAYVPDKTKEELIKCFLQCLRETLEEMQNYGIEIYI
ncbi:HTH-type transcriptional regulator CynR [Clostridiales bacterium]|nr:HTH-type transcriptional regulator CynR [Clostridiales bacterium]